MKLYALARVRQVEATREFKAWKVARAASKQKAQARDQQQVERDMQDTAAYAEWKGR